MKIKKIFAIGMASILLAYTVFFPTTATYTVNSSKIGKTTPKHEFAIAAKAEYEEKLSSGTAYAPNYEEKDAIIQKYSFASVLSEKNTIAKEMKTMGLYVYYDNNLSVMNDTKPLTSPEDGLPTENDVELHSPIIVYCADNDTWYISTSGHWKNDDWHSDTKTGKLGAPNAFGYSFSDYLQETYRSSVVRTISVMWNQDFTMQASSGNRSDGSGSYGNGVRLSDKIVKNKAYNENDPESIPYYYIGYHWYLGCVYDSNFATFSAIATSYYIHLYDSAYIKDINFVAQPRFSITLSNKQDCFFAYSGDQAKTPGYKN